MADQSQPAIRLERATLRFGDRVLWDALDLEVEPGEFLAVLGPNGTGKTTLLTVLLGTSTITSGAVAVNGHPPRRGDRQIGYVPQQKGFDPDLAIRARDLVQFGLDGHRYGLPFADKESRHQVDQAIAAVGATRYQDAPVGMLSGGEQQRLRIAQALVGNPRLLLCDEPLLSLDLAHQRVVSELINARRETANTAVVFVTHDINPILNYVDRVLYLVEGGWAVGTPREIMTSEALTKLYGAAVDVLDVRGRIVVIGSDETSGTHDHAHHHHHDKVPGRRAR